MRYAARPVGGGGRACSVQLRGKARLEPGRKARVECTSNISSMFMTRDVSKFSGWLNAYASCRVERGYTMRGGRRGAAKGRRPRMQRAREGLTGVWAQGTGGVHLEHFLHGRDAGRVEAQRLVERLRFLPSRKGVYDARRSPRGGGRACSVRRKAPLESGRRVQTGCTLSISAISVTLDVSKFSGWLNAFASCRVKRGPYDAGCGGRPGRHRRRGGWSVGRVAAHVACKEEGSTGVCGRRAREQSAP